MTKDFVWPEQAYLSHGHISRPVVIHSPWPCGGAGVRLSGVGGGLVGAAMVLLPHPQVLLEGVLVALAGVALLHLLELPFGEVLHLIQQLLIPELELLQLVLQLALLSVESLPGVSFRIKVGLPHLRLQIKNKHFLLIKEWLLHINIKPTTDCKLKYFNGKISSFRNYAWI